MNRIISRLRQKQKEKKGQGLVEYALILVLVTIVVIAIVTLLGRSIADTYCGVVFSMGQNGSGSAKMCKNPIATCKVIAVTATTINMEVVVIDPDKPANITLSDEIQVNFYVNGTLQPLWVQADERFCIGGGGEPPATTQCTATRPVSSGDVIRAVATDQSQNSGECTYRVP